jgi:molybdenum cofactor cytidylyltransferase
MTALIILAAGASTRLGQPKQNLLFQNSTLLQKAIETGIASGCRPLIVVLGANAEQIHLPVENENVEILINGDWVEGMASSIRVAINQIENNAAVEGAIIMLCDQPYMNVELLGHLQKKQVETNKPIVACEYSEGFGVPALFDRLLFDDLRLLTGNEGAKKIIKNHPDHVATISFEKGSIDIDTMEDYERLIKGLS